jgi:hypothetical protein
MLSVMGPDRAGSWSNRDFEDEVPRPRGLFRRGGMAGLLTLTALFVFLFAAQHEVQNCGDACYDGGLRTFERGHAWTAYESSWQWQAQWALGFAALGLAIVGLATASRLEWRTWTVRALAASVGCMALWGAWVVLEPAIPS